MNGLSMALRFRVRELREAQGWTQGAFAERAGVRRATVNAIENNKTSGIDLAVLEKLARTLGVAAGYLIVDVPGEKRPTKQRRRSG